MNVAFVAKAELQCIGPYIMRSLKQVSVS